MCNQLMTSVVTVQGLKEIKHLRCWHRTGRNQPFRGLQGGYGVPGTASEKALGILFPSVPPLLWPRSTLPALSQRSRTARHLCSVTR